MADRSSQNKEVEHGVHIAAPIEAVKEGTCDVAHALANNPCYGGGAHTRYQRFKGHEHAEAHRHEADGLDLAVPLERDKTFDGARYGCRPYKDEQRPSPVAVVAHGDERDGRVAARYVPVDGGVVPFAQPLFPWRPCTQGVIYGAGYV